MSQGIEEFDEHVDAFERGASMAEYGLLAVLIAVVALFAIAVAGEEVSSQYSEIASHLIDAGS